MKKMKEKYGKLITNLIIGFGMAVIIVWTLVEILLNPIMAAIMAFLIILEWYYGGTEGEVIIICIWVYFIMLSPIFR